MESVYTRALAQLQERRKANRKERERREQEVRELRPDFVCVETKLRSCGAALARRVMEHTANLSDIEASVKALQAEKAKILKELGKPKDYLDDIYTCPLCHDQGTDEHGRRCGCMQALISAALVAESNLAPYMKEQTFNRFDFTLFSAQKDGKVLSAMQYAHQTALTFAETFDATHENLLLTGNAGTGKTFLSGCIANYALARQKFVCYQSAFRLFDGLEKLKFGRAADEEEALTALSRQVYHADLLILDDLGTEFITAYSTALLFDIINARLIRQKSTVLSTNLDLATLDQIYSTRLTSRILGSYRVLPFLGNDLRKQTSNLNKKRDSHE